MSRSLSEDFVRLLAKLPQHQNLIVSFILIAGVSLGTGLLLGQLLSEGRLTRPATSSYSKLNPISSQLSSVKTSTSVAVLSSLDQKTKVTNLNTATILELDNLPGIGLTYAQKIILGRPYRSISELLTKKIIPLSTYNKLKAQLGV